MNVVISARNKQKQNMDYTELSIHGLSATVDVSGGIGSPDQPYRAALIVRNDNREVWSGVIRVELPFAKTNPRFFLPAFMYGRNRGESPQNVLNEFPRLREGHSSRPSSSWWMTRSDRLSHPAALVYDSGRITGICASPYFMLKNGTKQQWMPGKVGEFYQYGGFTCSLSKGTVGYTLGYENAPWMFIKSKQVAERAPLSENVFELAAGESVSFEIDIYDYEAESPLGINAALEQIYYRYHEKPRKGSAVQIAAADLSKAVSQYAWLPEELSYSGFVFEDEPGSGKFRYNKLFSISWTNGLSVATPVLIAALRLDDEDMRQQALSCITNIVENSINPASGLPYETYGNGQWSIKGWWFDGIHTPGHSSYLACQAMYYILKAYEYEKRLKTCTHDEWLPFVHRVLMQMERTKNTDGEYPYILSEETGAGLEYDSFGGAWAMTALAYYCWLTEEHSHLESLRLSEAHYYNRFVKRMECYGAPLDTDKTIDSEGILAYIKAVRYLHAMTGEQHYLDNMRDAICYESTFKFVYNSPIKVPPLSRIGWSSSGGSVTSVSNPHIHPMSNNSVDELLYYVEQTDDAYVRERMLDTVGWGCQTYNRFDLEFDYGRRGWMSERFCHSEGLLTQKYSDGSPASTWFCLMPWASGSIIEGLVGDFWDSGFA
ncbi:hypothetical protein [Paenibacillus sp. LPE1-1-1.1]|uniref:hypothetical protein n=1 Tax=Paenibacillus sp. LPE1-1-1.1 TaxID=3135230 RepID=UPI00343A8D4B